VPLYEIAQDGLVPFRQLRGGAGLFESMIEDLLWDNLEDITGQVLFPVRRQAAISGGGRPDIVALDRTGSVVVIEVKRDVDRSQLAQCLEYAGWARTTNLDELAGLYHEGAERFWSRWQEFTGTDEPQRVTKSPRLILVARDFDGRTNSALEFLQDNGLPITLIRLSVYEDRTERRFLDVDGVDEPSGLHDALRAVNGNSGSRRTYGVTLADLVGADLLRPGDELVWQRRRAKLSHVCTVTEDARLRLDDGSLHSSPSGAANKAASGSYDGWECWRLKDGRLLSQLREDYLAADAAVSGIASVGRS
jgi:hypothetical protein